MKQSKHEKWFLKDELIEKVNNIKYLGILINFKSSWKLQNKSALIAGNLALKTIRSVNNKLPNTDSKLLTRIYKALVESKMLYGIQIWGDSESWNNLDKIRARFCKIILGIPGSASIILVMTLSSRGRALTSSGNRSNHSYFYNFA